MKLKELKKCREKLCKYDEFEKWVEILTDKSTSVVAEYDRIVHGLRISQESIIPSHIREIFVNALKIEIEKIDNE